MIFICDKCGWMRSSKNLIVAMVYFLTLKSALAGILYIAKA